MRHLLLRNLSTVGWAVVLFGAVVPWTARAQWPIPTSAVNAWAATALVVGFLLVFAGPRAAWPKKDPKGYLSVALPALAIGLATILAVTAGVPSPIAFVPTVAAIIFVAGFVIGGRRVWELWARYALRRPRLGPIGVFRNLVLQQLRATLDELLAIHGDPSSLRTGRVRAEGFLDAMRQIPAPSSDWGAIRDAYARRLHELIEAGDTPDELDLALRAWVEDPDVARLRSTFDQLSPMRGLRK